MDHFILALLLFWSLNQLMNYLYEHESQMDNLVSNMSLMSWLIQTHDPLSAEIFYVISTQKERMVNPELIHSQCVMRVFCDHLK